MIKDYIIPFSFRNYLLVYFKGNFIDNSRSLDYFDIGGSYFRIALFGHKL